MRGSALKRLPLQRTAPTAIRIASCMAENAARFAREVGAYLGASIGIPTEFVDDVPWREREQQLYTGGIQLCWICGLPYVRQWQRGCPSIELLAAPVMAAPRYGRRAVYFSDLIVRANHAAGKLDELRGLRIAYNEPNSHSGYTVLCHALESARAERNFFARVVETGAHQRSIEMVLAGLVDAAVIDSTVLETELEARPDLGWRLRTIEVLGPSPMPPWVVHRDLPERVKADLLQALLHMGEDTRGRKVLADARVAHFQRVSDAWYDPIRTMGARAQAYPLSATHRVVESALGFELCPA